MLQIMFIVFSEWHSIYAFLGWLCIREEVFDYLSLSMLNLIISYDDFQ